MPGHPARRDSAPEPARQARVASFGLSAGRTPGRHETAWECELMRDPSAEFMQRLDQTHPETLSGLRRGTIRFDLESGERTDHWLIRIDEGIVHTSRHDQSADCVVHAEKKLFDCILAGEVNFIAALFRNQLTVEGDMVLLTTFRKLLPGPPGAHDPGAPYAGKGASDG